MAHNRNVKEDAVSKLRVAPTPAAAEASTTTEELRSRLEKGSLSLRGVASALDLLAEDLEDSSLNIDAFLPAAANILGLLGRDVEREADAMGDAEAFLNGTAVA